MGVLGIDLGGTQVRAGLVEEGRLLRASGARVAGLATAQDVLERIYAMIEEVGLEGVSGIGVGVPSIVDVKRGIVYDTVNIPSWKEVYLKDLLEQRYGIPAFVNNDANCFALGEWRYGAGAGSMNMVGVTVGTGLGAGIIIEGRLFNGTHCGAGEVGNIKYLDSVIEAYASGQFFMRTYGVSGEIMLARVLEGEVDARTAFYEFGLHLGEALLTILYAYDPEVIVLGGSVTASYGLFEEGMWASLRRSVFPHALKDLSIKIAQMKEIAIIGAACLALVGGEV